MIYGLPINDDNTLEVVIVQGKHYSNSKLLETLPTNHKVSSSGGGGVGQHEKTASGGSICRCRRRQRRQKHNATQTPLAVAGWQQLSDNGSCGGGIDGSGSGGFCPSVCTMNTHCFQQLHHHHHSQQHGHLPTEQHISAGAELTCHCHITHHCHQYSPSGQSQKVVNKHNHQHHHRQHGNSRSSSHRNCPSGHTHHKKHTRTQHSQQHHHYQQRQQQNSAQSHYGKQNEKSIASFKSSFDSSAEQLCRHQRQGQSQQEIAIEIDAATVTEDNGSTGTSNFAYKMAKDQPLENHHHQQLVPFEHRRRSFNSNTTIETDELSNDDEDADNDREEVDENAEIEELTPRRNSERTENNSSITPRAMCCDLDDGSDAEPLTSEKVAYCPYGVPLPKDIRNERVRIKRKRFNADPMVEYCSSCSSCSCSRCDDNTSSCSSLDNDDDLNVHGGTPHEFTVSAECHHCNLPRQSSSASTTGEADDEEEEQPFKTKIVSIQGTLADSQYTSRRSSESFCSCNSNSCYYCSCSCDECDTTGRMRTAREAVSNATTLPNELDEQHSSTLTPLTNPSSVVTTPLADDGQADLTIRSGTSNIFNSAIESGGAEDASSLSQSAEYFSMSSSNQPSRATPTITPVHKPIVAGGNSNLSNQISHQQQQQQPQSIKQCKHYSKHHRHKHTDTTQDGYL